LELPGLLEWPDETIGGLVAANSGYWDGISFRGWGQSLLAVRWIDGRGQSLHFGRKTLKNVAGYDVVKLAVGSRGTLGALAEMTFRLWPDQGRRYGWVIKVDVRTGLALLPKFWQPLPGVDGCLITVSDGTMDVVLTGPSQDHESVGVRIANLVGEAAIQSEGPEIGSEVQRVRRATWYDGVGHHPYRRGFGGLTDVVPLIEARQPGANLYLFPYQREFEILGPVLVPTSVADADPVQRALEEGVRRAFNPTGVWLHE
jgi:hypothetical protein